MSMCIGTVTAAACQRSHTEQNEGTHQGECTSCLQGCQRRRRRTCACARDTGLTPIKQEKMQTGAYLLNSPSVMLLMPTSRCSLTIAVTASSSTTLSSSAEHLPSSNSLRFARSASGRLREPMWSARKGGLSLLVDADMVERGACRRGGEDGLEGN